MSFYEPETLDQHVKSMHKLGDILVPFNFPRADQSNEDSIGVLKRREAIVDGYELVLYYNKSDYPEHYLETFQVMGKWMPFLPFHLVCKLGKRFLGDRMLSLVEIFRDNRKIYCWNVAVTKDGKTIERMLGDESEEMSFEGFKYQYMNPNAVNFH